MTDDTSRAFEHSIEYKDLYYAANEDDTECLKVALLPSLNFNALEADRLQGRTALHIAARNGRVPAIQFLLAHGAEFDLRNSKYETPLHSAA